jgi:hypothetical protein
MIPVAGDEKGRVPDIALEENKNPKHRRVSIRRCKLRLRVWLRAFECGRLWDKYREAHSFRTAGFWTGSVGGREKSTND